jgi:shikimate kinase
VKTVPIAIVGFMGCGKTAVAEMLAALLDRKVIDLDELITRQHARTPAEIIKEDGEAAFRSIETSALKDLLQSGYDGVVSIGGGGWIELANRRLLRESGAMTVWLAGNASKRQERSVQWHQRRTRQEPCLSSASLFTGRQLFA